MCFKSEHASYGAKPSWIRPQWRLGRKVYPAYLLCGLAGLLLAVIFTVVLTVRLELSPLVMVGITGVAVATFWGLAVVTKAIVGKETLIYYHHEIAVLGSTALFLTLTGQPLWAYLDITLLGIGVFLACGRVGCLMAGCCHGRPFRWGVTYGPAHVRRGFTSYYAHVPLFPVQALEMLWVWAVVAVGGALVLSGHPPGTALAWYVIAYDLGRFSFEFLRGDPVRPYFMGFSEAQWISLLLMGIVAVLELTGILPLVPWHLAVTALVALVFGGLALYRLWAGAGRHRWLSPPHVRRIARALDTVVPSGDPCGTGMSMTPDRIPVARTSLGLQISAGPVPASSGVGLVVTLSSQDEPLTEQLARKLSRVIGRLRRWGPPDQFLQGRPGVFHLLFTSPYGVCDTNK